MLIGYARVSTDDQNLDLQRDALQAAGCERVFEDLKSMSRPGDTIVLFVSDKASWENHAGESGYALIRGGCTIKQIIDWRS